MRTLRRLVTVLTVVLTLGMIAIAGAIVWRLVGTGEFGSVPMSADEIALPAGLQPTALGGAGRELFVLGVREDGTESLLVYDRASGALLSDTKVRRTP